MNGRFRLIMLLSRPMKRMLIISITLYFAAGCAAEIGDDCDYDVDCSPNMDRNCDNSQPGGYCLTIGCSPDECPSEAVCVEFTPPCPEYEDESKCRMIEPNRERTYCMKHCKSNGSCRSNYTCVEVDKIEATIIDQEKNKSKICVPKNQ